MASQFDYTDIDACAWGEDISPAEELREEERGLAAPFARVPAAEDAPDLAELYAKADAIQKNLEETIRLMELCSQTAMAQAKAASTMLLASTAAATSSANAHKASAMREGGGPQGARRQPDDMAGAAYAGKDVEEEKGIMPARKMAGYALVGVGALVALAVLCMVGMAIGSRL